MFEKLEAELKHYKEELTVVCADVSELKTGVKDSFDNALEQVQFLNPTIEMNLTGVQYNAYIEDGNFIAPPSSSTN